MTENKRMKKKEKIKWWEKRVSLWEESNLRQNEFCKKFNLDVGQFGYWKRKLRSHGGVGNLNNLGEAGIGFKTLILKCLGKFILFTNSLEKSSVEQDEWKLDTVWDQLKFFLRLYQKAVAGDGVESDFEYFELTKQETGAEWSIKSNVLDITVTRNDLEEINKIFIKLTKVTNAVFRRAKIPDEYTHFIFLGEKRSITTKVIPNSDNVTDIYNLIVEDGWSGTWIPPRHFRSNAKKAIALGEVKKPIDKGLTLHTIHEHFYQIKPFSQLPQKHSFSHKLLHILPEPIYSSWKKDEYFLVPSIPKSKFTTFPEVVCSLFVQYFVEFGDFKRISICKNCHSLYLQMSEDLQKYCSDDCNQDFHRRNRSELKNDCREKQRGWFKRYTESPTIIELPAETCVNCSQVGIRGGGCDVLWEEHETEVKNRFYRKHGESIYVNVCRTYQLNYFEGKVRFKKKKGYIKRGNIANRKFCLLCPQCYNDHIPDPGTCQRILSKFANRITSEE